MTTVIKVLIALILLLVAIKLGVDLWHVLEPAHYHCVPSSAQFAQAECKGSGL